MAVKQSEKTLPLPPGPPWHQVWRQGPKIDRAKFMLKLHRTYGDIVRVQGFFPVYSVNNPDTIRHILTKAWPSYTKNTIDYRVLSRVFGSGLVTNDGENWAKQRRLIQPVFTNSNINQFDKIINAVTAKLTEEWINYGPNKTIWLDRDMSRITFQIVCRTLFGGDFDHHADEIASLLKGNSRHPQSFESLLTLCPWIPTTSNKVFIDNMRKLDSIVFDIIKAHRDGKGTDNDIVHRLLTIRDPDSGAAMTDQQIRDEILTLMLAGHETSATALNWTFYLLSQNSEIKKRLESELDNVLKGSPAMSFHLPKLPYLKQVIQESMRIYPPVWGLARKSTVDSHFNGFRIPRNSYISVIIYAVHRHPEFWPNPERFDPDRFSPNNNGNRHSYAYLPFSAGPRACIGANMSMLEIQLILAQLLQRFDVIPIPDHPITAHAGVTLKPAHGIAVNVKNK